MSAEEKYEQLKKKLESHLRRTSRQLVKFNSLDETLNYLIELFWLEFTCDFVAIILNENQSLVPKVWKGEITDIKNLLSLPETDVSNKLTEQTMWWQKEMLDLDKECQFIRNLQAEKLTTWFTVPLRDDGRSFGFLIVGFRNFVPIIMDLEQSFVEFGKDVAVAMGLALEKESQKRKIKGIEWLKENVFGSDSIEQLVNKIVRQAGNGTSAKAAFIYLYDDNEHSFVFQPPAFGEMSIPDVMNVEENKSIKEYFPHLEEVGGREITVPLVVNLKTIGVLHVIHESKRFTDSDLELLQFLSSHVSAMIENARLYSNEINDKKRLKSFMEHHKKLVKHTVDGEGLDGITETLYDILQKSIVLLDRFFRPVSFNVAEENILERVIEAVSESKHVLQKIRSEEKWLRVKHQEDAYVGIWPVIGGGDLLGYLALYTDQKKISSNLRITLDYALNVYAIQFIKKKLIMDTEEQLKDYFVNQFLNEKIESKERLLEYSHLLNWNVFEAHRIGTLSIQLEEQEMGLLDFEARKTFIWDKIKDHLSIMYKDIITTRKSGEFVLIVPCSREKNGVRHFWNILFDRIKEIVHYESHDAKLHLGIGDASNKLEDYYTSFKQAQQTLNIIVHRHPESRIAVFEELGAYTVLFNKNVSKNEEMFLAKYLFPLAEYSKSKDTDLFHTLRVFLSLNKNAKRTAEALFIHRSTLMYRLEKISELLGVNLDDADESFNLMMAYKLYDLHFADGRKE
ncbi:helix-turn-helix domain-containing protein [Ferviditalea candida]|uniref:Helix-turn-helix domain-containing protein n=1 Tax=Ferviditalea candida TaxID=3108399 RepID=A0ABU5ZQU9_9BACL|nr:helix-turn-helix domain-containing protein [Paenibacillaceae bacterium T2]